MFIFEAILQVNKSKEILRQYWGYDSFRLGQEEIIEDVLYGHDTLALLPTGGGKSICFQVPGIARDGITIVISPLIALMEDQVNTLNRKGLRARALISGMTYRELDITLDNAKFGAIDFLYTSPERIQSPLFIERFKQMNIGLIVVDEAHCISEWGHDFRPSFKAIKNLRQHHPEVPIIALTATATSRTKQDIIEQLELKKPKIHQSKFERENLIYKNIHSENKLGDILYYCEARAGVTGIIYCQTRKSVKDVAKHLHQNKIKVGIYHGGMSKEDRSLMLNDWLTDKIDVMIATNAFGMGIDKPDVRYVLHYEFPLSLEAYFQEAGRAGRDGHLSMAVNFWNQNDVQSLKNTIARKFPELATIKLVYRALCNHLQVAIGSGLNESYNLDMSKLTKNFNLSMGEAYNALKFLELNGELVFSEGFFHPTKVKIAIGNTALYNFQIQHEKLSPLITIISRSYPGIFEHYFELNEKEICKRLKISSKELENQLKFLEQYGVIDVSWRSNLPTVTFLHERLPDDYLEIKPEIYLQRKELAENKVQACVDYMTIDKCRSQQLIEYFGIESHPCGHCDVCKHQSEQLSDEALIQLIINKLKDNPSGHQNLLEIFHDHTRVERKIRELMKNEIITYHDEKYILKNV